MKRDESDYLSNCSLFKHSVPWRLWVTGCGRFEGTFLRSIGIPTTPIDAAPYPWRSESSPLQPCCLQRRGHPIISLLPVMRNVITCHFYNNPSFEIKRPHIIGVTTGTILNWTRPSSRNSLPSADPNNTPTRYVNTHHRHRWLIRGRLKADTVVWLSKNRTWQIWSSLSLSLATKRNIQLQTRLTSLSIAMCFYIHEFLFCLPYLLWATTGV
jgi:hypothetical protein